MSEEKETAIELFRHADIKIEKTREELSQLKEIELTLKDMMSHLTKRVDFGVSKTGQENKDTLAKHSLILNNIDHALRENKKWREDYEEHVDDRFEGMKESFKEALKPIGDTVKNIYRSLAFLVIGTVGGAGLLVSFRLIAKWLTRFLEIN